MSATFTLRVTPEILKAKAKEITDEVSSLESNWSKIETIITNSKNYWEGDGSNMHQSYLKEVKSDVVTILKRLKEHPTDLLNMANLYDEAEEKANELSRVLPTDIIS